MVELRVLGPLRAVVDGAEVDLGGPLRRAVLARLAVADGAVVPTDRLVDDLWRGEPPPRALAALQAHVSHLRRVLEPGRAPRTPSTVIVSAAPGYALRVGEGLDAARVRALADRAPDDHPAAATPLLAEALDAWSGPTLHEFADEPWAVPAVVGLEALHDDLVQRLAAAELALGDAASAARRLQAHVAEHPLHEEAVLTLARAWYRTGRQADALAVLGETRRRLDRELGVALSPRLRALEAEVLAHDPALLTPASPVPTRRATTSAAPDPPDGPVLLGRATETARVLAAAARVRTGPGELVLVGGEAGAGKTTLLEAMARELAGQGWTVAIGRCPEVDDAPPGWCWQEVAETLGTPSPPAPTAFARGQALLAALRDRPGPHLVCLEDLHRADVETLRLTRTVVSAAVPGVLVLAGFRPDEAGDRLTDTLAALAVATGDRLDLRGLDADACRALMARHGVQVDAADAARTARRTGGNPLFVRETARLAATVGLDAARDAVPAGVRDVLRRRIAQLPARSAAILRRAAVLAADVEVDLLLACESASSTAQDPDALEDAVLAALEAAVLVGLLVEPRPGRVAFAHDLVREVLVVEVPRLRRARMHLAVLDVLERHRPSDVIALAHHALAAGRGAGAVRVLDHVLDAVRVAPTGHQRAAEMLGAALALAAPDAVDAARLARAHRAHASALAHLGALRPAVAARAAALALARADPCGDLLAAVTCLDAPVPLAIADEEVVPQALLTDLDGLLARPHPDPDRARLLVTRALALQRVDPGAARADADGADALTRDLPARSTAGALLRCQVLNARVLVGVDLHNADDLAPLGEELLVTAERAGSPDFAALGHHARFLHALHRLEIGRGARHAADALAVVPDAGLGAALAWSSMFEGLRALVAGRPGDAEAVYTRVTATMSERGAANAEGIGFLGTYCARHAMDDVAGTLGLSGALMSRAPHIVADPHALALLHAGRAAEAAAVWRPELPIPPDRFGLLRLVTRAEVALGLGELGVLRACHAELAGWAGHLAGVHSGIATLGPVGLVLADADRALGHGEALRQAHLDAAAATCARLGAEHWAARVERAR